MQRRPTNDSHPQTSKRQQQQQQQRQKLLRLLHLNSLLGASFPTLCKMVRVQPSSVSLEAVDVIITFHSDASPIYVAADAHNWEPQLMSGTGEGYEHVITVPRSTRTLLYKFRIGDHHWVHDGAVCAEPDNRGGWNNKFDIPELSYAESVADDDEDLDAELDEGEMTELESVAGVESVADTVSEVAESERSEAEFIDMDDFYDDPDFPRAYSDHPQSGGALHRYTAFAARI